MDQRYSRDPKDHAEALAKINKFLDQAKLRVNKTRTVRQLANLVYKLGPQLGDFDRKLDLR